MDLRAALRARARSVVRRRSRPDRRPFIGFDACLPRGSHAGTALFSFLPQPFFEHEAGRRNPSFTHWGTSLSVATALNRAGFRVDVIDWQDCSFVPEKTYDLAVFHGGWNFDHVYPRLHGAPPLVYFSRGAYWRFQNRQEQLRLRYFSLRHGVALPPDRLISAPEETVTRSARGIVTLGNDFVGDTYTRADFANVLKLDNASTVPIHVDVERDFESARRSFLFLSAGGNVHKGLDLAIDAISTLPDLSLFVVTPVEPRFRAVYDDLLAHNPRIQVHGVLGLDSPQLRDLAARCGFCLLLSCSEGSPGSIVDGMRFGLVPVVTRSSGVDVEDFGISIERANVRDVRETLRSASEIEPDELRRRSERALEASATRYSVDTFERAFERHVLSLLRSDEETRAR